MTEILRDQAVVKGSPAAVWAIVEDPIALARVLPGAESIVATGPSTFRGVLAARIQFLTIRADIEASYHDADPPHHLRLQLDGRPRGIAGSLSVSIPFDLKAADGPDDSNVTAVTYTVDLHVTGRLATFGVPLLRETLRRQIAALVENVDHELADRASRGSP